MGHLGNELADTLAKEGASLPAEGPFLIVPTPHAYIKSKIQTHVQSIWTREWHEPKGDFEFRETKLWFPEPNNKFAKQMKSFKRKELARMVEFITGHCNLNHHVWRADKTKQHDQTCRLCEMEGSIETPKHFILECPRTLYYRWQINLGPEVEMINPDWTPIQLFSFINMPMIRALLEESQ